MIIQALNKEIDFIKCMNQDVWKSVIIINQQEFELEIPNHEKSIKRNTVKHFIEALPLNLNLLLSTSEKLLKALAFEIEIVNTNTLSSSYVHLNAINYLSSNEDIEQPKHSKLAHHHFELLFSLENEKVPYLDTYGSWETAWKGNNIYSVKRIQI